MGNGPRGLQRRRRRVGLLPARSRTVACVPLERGRDGRASPTSVTSSASRSRSGTAATRSSRSGCSASPAPKATTARTSRSTGGTSTASPATPGCAGATTTPRPRSPTRTSSTRTADAGFDDPEYELLDTGVFDDGRYWIVDVIVREGIAHRRAGANHGREPGRRRPPRSTCSRRCGFGTPGAGQTRTTCPRCPSTATRSPSSTERLGGYRLEAAAASDGTEPEVAVLRQRDQHRPPLRCRADHALSEGRDQRPRGRTVPRPSNPRRNAGRRPRGGTTSPSRPASGSSCGCACTGPTRRRIRPQEVGRATRSTPSCRRASADADEFYAAIAPDGVDAERMRVVRQSCAGPRLEQADVPVSGQSAGSTVTRANRRHRPDIDTAATPAGATSTRSTCWPCPTRGSTRGSQRGTSRSTPSSGRTSTRRSPSTSSSCCSSEWFLHPNGALPAYEWSFDDVNPPVHALAAIRVFVIDGADRPRLPRTRLPEAAPELHLVAEPRGSRRQQPVRRRLPRARQHQPHRPIAPAPGDAAASRPTAPRGWPTTHWRCSGSRSRSPDETTCTRTWSSSSSSSSSWSSTRSRPRGATTPTTASSTTRSSTEPPPHDRSGCRHSSA